MTKATKWRWLTALVMALLLRPQSAPAQELLLDDFEEVQGWSARASKGTDVWIVQDTGRTGMGMRIGFDLNSGGGYIVVRKTFSLPLPENYAFSFYLRGEGQPNNFEFKLIDPSGNNVWWHKQRDFSFPTDWQRVTIRKSRIERAWGPSADGSLDHVGAIEFGLSAGSGGRGSIWIDNLDFEAREPASHNGSVPDVHASTSLSGHGPERMLDQDPASGWKSETLPGEQWVLVDLRKNEEYGGLVIDWDAEDYATFYQVLVSNDGTQWASAYTTATGHGGRDYIYLPDAESRYIRLDLTNSSRGQGYGIATLTVKPFEFSASPNQFFEAIARDAPIGTYPKYFYGTQTFWTVVGVNGDDKEGLLNQEGMLEVDKGSFSVEPFLYADGKLITWNSVRTVQSLEDGYLPIPTVTWEQERFTLKITAFASGEPGASTLYARYRLENRSERTERARLYLAIRPFQVNPPWQSLNMNGGVTHIRKLQSDGRVVRVNGDKAVVSLTSFDQFGAATFERGSVTNFLLQGQLPPLTEVSDPFGFASGALSYSFDLGPGHRTEVDLAIPFHGLNPALAGLAAPDSSAFVESRLDETRRYWRTILNRVDIDLPPEAGKIVNTLKTTVAYILINRDGAALKPGSRNYSRSWIRDGAATSAALLEMGITEEVRDFIRWFAKFQSPDGRVPCCIDERGADPVTENDSHGELIYAIAQYYRHTRDVGFLNDMWPHIVGAVEHMSLERKQRMTDEYKAPDMLAFFGLLPESISHEGYSAHPVHAYWDNFFALRGFKDAADMAAVVGDYDHAASFAALRDDFRRDLYASISKTIANHDIDYIPGSVELGDFDPTSTAIALDPGGERENLPEPQLSRTFEIYYDNFLRRRNGEALSDSYTAYELRNVSALIRLGEKDRAIEVLKFFLADQRPEAWNEWAEVSWRDPGAPRFIGDMPHTWVGAGFIRGVRSMLAYDRESDRALVIAAGLPADWVLSEPGVTVKRLSTHYGVLNYSLHAEGPSLLRLRMSGDITLPPGKIVVQSPLERPLVAVGVNGKPISTFTADSATIEEFPADVVLEYKLLGG